LLLCACHKGDQLRSIPRKDLLIYWMKKYKN
jgi:hypothetical protein